MKRVLGNMVTKITDSWLGTSSGIEYGLFRTDDAGKMYATFSCSLPRPALTPGGKLIETEAGRTVETEVIEGDYSGSFLLSVKDGKTKLEYRTPSSYDAATAILKLVRDAPEIAQERALRHLRRRLDEDIAAERSEERKGELQRLGNAVNLLLGFAKERF